MIEELRVKFDRKIESVEMMFETFEELMLADDITISIFEANMRGVLENDEVYNHPFITTKDRQAIKDRTMKEEDYMKYVFSAFSSEILRESPEVAITKIADDPKKISIEKVIASGKSKSYLIRKAQEHNLGLEALEMVVEMKTRYQTILPVIFKLMSRGLSVNQVDSLFEIYEYFEKGISMGLIINFCRVFYTGDLSMSNCEIIDDIVREFRYPYSDTSLRKFMEFALSINCYNAQEALDIYQDLRKGRCIRHYEGVYVED